MLAFVLLDLTQGYPDAVVDHLTGIPEVVEAHTVTGDGDLLCRVVARDTEELEGVIQRLIAMPGAQRTRSQISLSQRVPLRVLPLVSKDRWPPSRSRQRAAVPDGPLCPPSEDHVDPAGTPDAPQAEIYRRRGRP
jgi:hypothetical protein